MIRDFIECLYCGKGLRVAAPSTVRAVVGWETNRGGIGGLNRLMSRTPLEAFAHLGCARAADEVPVEAAQATLDSWVGGGA